jgi:transcriptional regulator
MSDIQSILPPLSRLEEQQLRDSIKEHGFIGKILKDKKGKVIDGNHRQKIYREIKGEDPPAEVLDVPEREAYRLAIQLNIARRQLSHEQEKEIIRQLREYGFTQQEVADTLGTTQKTIDNKEGESISNSTNTFNAPDLRISVPRKDYSKIHERIKSGETRNNIAADYKVTPQRVGQIVTLFEKRQAKPEDCETVPYPEGKYRCLVIDPPRALRHREGPVTGHNEENPDPQRRCLDAVLLEDCDCFRCPAV